MSLRPDAPYRDEVREDGAVLIYEGHDAPKTIKTPEPKRIDQPEFLPSGNLTENGKFHNAAQGCRNGKKVPDVVCVYEKIKKGIWSYNGFFHLIDSWIENDGKRKVFKFKLEAIDEVDASNLPVRADPSNKKHRRIIRHILS